jgi:glycosyltransferase involved in cell wall biosynthesis
MRVLIVNNMAPFIWGGAEELAKNLEKNLIIAGHDAEILRIPFQFEPASLITSQMLMVRAFELWNVDHVIGLKFPAYMIKHPRKTLWLLHQYRQAYDLFGTGHTNIPDNNEGHTLRNVIKYADNDTFNESRFIYTNSKVTRDRLKKYNGFDAEVLLPPVNNPELFKSGKSEKYIFAGGRINDFKRQHLLVEAMSKTKSVVKLIVAGPPDNKADADKLRKLVKKYNLEDRVKLDLRFLSRQEYADYINAALAVAYLPIDEDSLGYVSMEAATAGKPILTGSDSGGLLGLVKDMQTGWVSDPNIQSISHAMESIFGDLVITKKYGESARDLWKSLDINWQNVIEKLLK